MTLNAHPDNLVLVAPRPVRLAAPTPYAQLHSAILQRPQPKPATLRFIASPSDAFEKLKLGDESQEDMTRSEPQAQAERDVPPSPRASPRSTPPSEALEEFLSILRPATILFPPTSPILRPSNGLAHGFRQYRRPPSSALTSSMTTDGLGVTLLDQSDNGSKENDVVPYPFKILGTAHLSSPVSRTHPLNAFPRQVVVEAPVTAFITEQPASPSSAAADTSPSGHTSPSAVPLPLPTPDEMELESVS